MPPDAVVTGGSGFVGGDLLARLVERGDAVRALVRSEVAAETVRARGAQPVVVDLFDADGLRKALSGVRLLFHVAGVNDTCPRDPAAMDRVNVEGTRCVIDAASEAGVERVVLTSSAATIGERTGTVGAERTRHGGRYLSRYARSKHQAELVAFDTARARGIDVVVVNPSSVQGPGRAGGSARLLLYLLRAHRPWLVETSISLIDIADCTEGHLRAASRGTPGERYLLSGATLGVSEAVDLASDTIGREIEPRWLSATTARVLGRPAATIVSWVKPDSGICPALIDTLLHGHRFDASRSERELGMSYRPVADTFERTVAWLRAEGLVT